MKRIGRLRFSMYPLVVATALVSLHKPIIGKGVAGKEEGAKVPQAVNQKIVESYGKLPLSFEANQGQTDSQVKFISRGSGYSLFLTSTEAVLSLQEPPARNGPLPSAPSAKSAAVLKIKLVGANPSPQLTGRDELPGKSNYFFGNNPAKWRTNVPNYAKVKYADVYFGIDLVYYGNQRQLEYDFVVAPGADPRAIRFAIDGDEKRQIDGQGDLVLKAAGREVRLHRPVIYQEINGARQHIGGNFVIHGTRQVGFEVARFDSSKPLIIDPVLSYSTYLGGSDAEHDSKIAVDSAGNAYVTGATASNDFPTANPLQAARGGDAFVTKLNAAGSALVYSTYLGGSYWDAGYGIAVDSSGNAYVTGFTSSIDFPTANAFQPTHSGPSGYGDAFVTKLNAAGSALLYSTYLGGAGVDGGDAIALDSSGNAYVTGQTESADFPIANAFQATYAKGSIYNSDGFVTKLNPAGSALVYSTYLGGSGIDEGVGIAVDSSGSAYVTGYTSSPNFPIVNALQPAIRGALSAFVTKLNAAGSAVYSTYLGGSGQDDGSGITVDSSGNVYVTGNTTSLDFPTANAFQPAHSGPSGYGDAFVTKLNATGSALVYSTYLGGSGNDFGYGVAVDSSGNAYITGYTGSIDFPTVNAFQAKFGGGDSDAFVTKLNATGSALVYSTYLGGSGSDSGSGIAVDSSGNAYVTGNTTSSDFPTANAVQPAYAGGNYFGDDEFAGDAFVAKFSAFLDPWQQAITVLKAAAGTDSYNFWQWDWLWQRTPSFPGAPASFGVLGSIDNTPGLMGEIIAAGGGNGIQNISAEQWVAYYRQVLATDPWQQAIARMQASAGTDSYNFWQWAWFWQRSPTFAGAPTGFGVLGSIDNTPGAIGNIIAAGGGDGFRIVSSEQWVLYYRQATSQ